MWFTKDIFALCTTLHERGLEPRFEVGDIVARGFADLGFEEFQVLPGPSLLSLTAGTVKPLPEDHRHHFFWIPSVDETVAIIEVRGAMIRECVRVDCREWQIRVEDGDGLIIEARARLLHGALLRILADLWRERGTGV